MTSRRAGQPRRDDAPPPGVSAWLALLAMAIAGITTLLLIVAEALK